MRGDVPSIYNTDREHTLRIAEEPFYKTTAAEFSRSQICVDVFSFAARYCDLASIGECGHDCVFLGIPFAPVKQHGRRTFDIYSCLRGPFHLEVLQPGIDK